MRGIFLSKKLIVVLVCFIMALLTFKRENTALGEAEARLIAKMLESDRIVEVFSMESEVVET